MYSAFEECSEEVGLEFDSRCRLCSWLSLSGCSFGFAAGLVGAYGRFQAGFELRCCSNDDLEGGWVEGPDPH